MAPYLRIHIPACAKRQLLRDRPAPTKTNNAMTAMPHMFTRRILLCVTGLSPQIVTETLYALAVTQTPAFLPTEIHLITTLEGVERARLTLLSEEPGWFRRLCADYQLDPAKIHFGIDTLHCIRGAAGRPLSDIRTQEDNTAVADTITTLVRDFTADPGCAVHASIAGGRKTMGFYLGYALSLLGRPQDRLSHVLVSSPFETHPQFFYTSPEPRVIFANSPDQRPLDTHTAQVTLADIPFVRLRDGLQENLLAPGASFSAVVAQAQRNLAAPSLTLNTATCQIRCGETPIPLRRVDFAFYAWLARRAQSGQTGVCRNEMNTEDSAAFLAEYAALHNEMDQDIDRVRKALANGMDPEYFDNRQAILRKALVRKLGNTGAQPYLIHNDKKRPKSRYALKLKPEQIHFEALKPALDDKLVDSDANDTVA